MRISFSTDMLPAGLSHDRKVRAFAEAMEEQRIRLDVTGPAGRFHGAFQTVLFKSVIVTSATASGLRVERTTANIARDNNDSLCLFMNVGRRPLVAEQAGQHVTVAGGGLTLYDHGGPNVSGAPKGGDALLVMLPRHKLGAAAGRAEANLLRQLDPGSAPFQLLRSYATSLAGSDVGIPEATADAVEGHLVDLFLLGIGVNGDDGEVARRRGLRSARLAAILEQLDTRCVEPGLAADDIGAALGISGRTVQHILYESGRRLSDELTSRRLERARRMLVDPVMCSRSIIDIALAAGFNDVSTFYRAFRARFGLTPTELRENREG